MLRALLMGTISIILASTAAYAHAMPMPFRGNCGQDNVTLSISFSIKTPSADEAKKSFDEKMKQFDEFVKEEKIKLPMLESMTYNIQQYNMGGGATDITYGLTGNSTYRMESADDAFKLGEFLNKQKFIVSVNVNHSNNGPCLDSNNIATPPPPPPPILPVEAPHSR